MIPAAGQLADGAFLDENGCMPYDENFVVAELARLGRLRQVLADTSALITLEKLALLETAQAALRVRTIPEVMAEWRRGSPSAPDLPLLAPLVHADYPALPTDRKLVAQAGDVHLTLFSEDRRILVEAEELGIPSLCVLFLAAKLLAEAKISPVAAWEARERLADENRYDQRRLGLFDQMLIQIEKRG
jgi:hypothetical protein